MAMMMGSRYRRGVTMILANTLTRGRFRMRSITLPTNMLAINTQATIGCSSNKRGPGWTLYMMKAPTRIAVVPDPGIPRVRSGINAPPDAALLADSGPATPSIAPLPNRSGCLLHFFSRMYEKKEAIVAPAPGRTPTKKPRREPRRMAGALRFRSSRPGSTLPTRGMPPGPSSLTRRVLKTSPRANKPTATVRNSRPWYRTGISKVKRATPDTLSTPIVPKKQAENGHDQRLGHGFARQAADGAQPQNHQGKIFRPPEAERRIGQGRRQEHQPYQRDQPGDEGTDRRDGQSGTRLSLPGHLVTVQGGDHGGGFAGGVQENGGGRPAVHRSVVNPGQQDDGAGGRVFRRHSAGHRRRDGNQEGHSAHGADPRQHADGRADQHPDKSEQQIVPLKGDEKPLHQILQRLHPSASLHPAIQTGHPGSVPFMTTAYRK